jgi:hypothetical protein
MLSNIVPVLGRYLLAAGAAANAGVEMSSGDPMEAAISAFVSFLVAAFAAYKRKNG